MTTRIETSHQKTTMRLDLRSTMLVDAAVSGLNAIAYLAGAFVLDRVLGVGAGFLLGLGAFLAGWAIALGWVGTRSPISPGHAREVGVLNLAWVVGSVAALLLLDLTAIGAAWCVAQAVVVAAFAVVQLRLVRTQR